MAPRTRHGWIGMAAVASALACSRPAPATPTPTPAPAAQSPAAPGTGAAQDAAAGSGPPAMTSAPSVTASAAAPTTTATPVQPAPPVPIRAAVAVAGGAEVALGAAPTAVVDPRATFRIEVATVLPDARLSLRDDQDAMVPSSGTTEVGATWTRFQLTPDAPLAPGTAYSLHVDGNASLAPHDASGQALRPLVLDLRTSGERPPAPARKRGARR